MNDVLSGLMTFAVMFLSIIILIILNNYWFKREDGVKFYIGIFLISAMINMLIQNLIGDYALFDSLTIAGLTEISGYVFILALGIYLVVKQPSNTHKSKL